MRWSTSLAWIESFNGRLRDELLNGWQFDSRLEARVLIEDWRIDYNEHRPTAPMATSPPLAQAELVIAEAQAAMKLEARMASSHAEADATGQRGGPEPPWKTGRRTTFNPDGTLWRGSPRLRPSQGEEPIDEVSAGALSAA